MDNMQLLGKLRNIIVPSVNLKETPYAVRYYPCGVELKDGGKLDCVCFINKKEFYRQWGDAPKNRLFVDLKDINDIFESTYRLNVKLAQRIYDDGDSGMFGFAFIAIMSDDERFSYVPGSLVDFLIPPEGYAVSSIVDVITHAGDSKTFLGSPDYSWCLVDDL